MSSITSFVNAPQEFLTAIVAAGIQAPDRVIPDGEIHRFSTNGKSSDDAGWYVLRERADFAMGSFGCWREGTTGDWVSVRQGATVSKEEIDRTRAGLLAKAEADRQARFRKVAEDAAGLWASLKPAPDDHPYLAKKGIKPSGARLYSTGPMRIAEMKCAGAIVVPAHDEHDSITTLEFIAPDGEKRFLAGGEKSGKFFRIGPVVRPGGTVLLCEGFATGATLHAATGATVLVAFDAGNLVKVAATLKGYRVIVCADNDRSTEGNPGVTKGGEAVRACGGALAVPQFTDLEQGSDWNDFASLRGLKAVSDAFRRHMDSIVLDLGQLSAIAGGLTWSVKGLVPERAMGMFYGASGAYKSFILLDYALHRAWSMDWLGRKTKPGRPVYVAGEGGAGLFRRIQAWHQYRRLDWRKCNLAVVIVPVTMLTQAGRLREQIQLRCPDGVSDVQIDTLSQTFTGNENSADDMAAYFRSIQTEIRDPLNCGVQITHHTGHSAAERPRGSSAIFANLDYLFRIDRPESSKLICTMVNTKQKDGELAADILFKLEEQVLGHDEDGDQISSLAAFHDVSGAASAAAMAKNDEEKTRGAFAVFMRVLKDGMTVDEARDAFATANWPNGDATDDAKTSAWSRIQKENARRKLWRIDYPDGVIRLLSRYAD